MKTFKFDHKIGKIILSFIQNYNHDKYWSRGSIVINPLDKTPIFLKLYYLYYYQKIFL